MLYYNITTRITNRKKHNMAYVILALAIVQLILATYNFCKVPKTLP
jgi:hypothetical protein